ncbi:MAG: hypothetical protein IPK67_14410 [Planctomycetes bacterium]|nr:hypothetical protein [Planctomycetota bacterium]
MKSLRAALATLLLCLACSSPVADHEQRWVEFGIVAEDEPIPLLTGKSYPFFGKENASLAPVRLVQPLLRCRVELGTMGFDHHGSPAVGVTLDDRDVSQFEAFTAANIDREMVVLVDGRIAFKANIGEKLPGRFQIYGAFTAEENDQIMKALQCEEETTNTAFQPATTGPPSLGKAVK